jgi:uncharacterized protein with NAD-binding domain and iron-sulfur cluster
MAMLERSSTGPLGRLLERQIVSLHEQLRLQLGKDEAGRRAWQLVDLVATCVRGALADRLLGDPERYATIDQLDFREWLRGHGASDEAVWSPVVNAMYDFVFAYENGDHERPAFAAGLGLFLATKLFFEYRGSIFWKMNAGMGDVVFAPMYQALAARGVRVELDHRAERLTLDVGRASVDCLQMSIRPSGLSVDDRLVRVKGLPCFRSTTADAPVVARRRVTLRRGEDFDTLVLAAPLGALPAMCADLIDASPAWSDMVGNIRTVATQGLQVWLTESEARLGWPHDGATVSGRVRPFDTYSSMTHLLDMEDWPDDDGRPKGLAYFCAALPDGALDGGEQTRLTAKSTFHGIDALWPRAVADGRFRTELFHGGFDDQYLTTNDAASDRYVQSLPGTSRYRLRPDQAGFDGLVLAGDWTNCGLNAGCIEAAAISGLEAANVVLGRPLRAGVSGSLYGLETEEVRP